MLEDQFSHKWRAFIGISLLSFGAYLDYTIVNVALPTIQQELKINLNGLQWVMNIYFLALCMLAAIMGRCGDLYGRRRLFYLGSAIFGIASVLAGLAPRIGWLIGGRLLQGVGAAIVFPLAPSLLPDCFPEKERVKVIAWFGSLGGIALALGPVLGGVIVAHWGWRWIFFINVPLVLSGYLFCFGSMKKSPAQSANVSLDWRGMLVLALAMGGIVLGLIRSTTVGWGSLTTWALLGLGMTASMGLVMIERRQASPLIDFADFSNLCFYAGAILGFLSGALSGVALFFDPLYLQIIKGQSPQLSGFLLFAIPVAVILAAPMVSGLIRCFGIVNTILIGLLVGLLATISHAFFTSASSIEFVLMAFVLLGGLWAMGGTVSIIATQTAVGSARASVATATVVTLFNMGGSIGLAIGVAIYHAAFSKGFMNGFSAVMWFLVALSLAVFLSVFLWKIMDKREKGINLR